MTARKIKQTKRVRFVGLENDWYGYLDNLFAEVQQMPIGKFGEAMIYSSSRFSKYIDNIDEEFDSQHRCTELNSFYASVFTTFCVDDQDRSVVTKKSALRAFNAFHLGNRSRAFYGFMSEAEAQKLLDQSGQWLLRMDEDGFIITEAISIAENGLANVKNYRLMYECGNFFMNGKAFAKLSHVTEVFPMEAAYCSSPYFDICYYGHPSYYSDGGDAAFNAWGRLIAAIKDPKNTNWRYVRSMMWALKIIGPVNHQHFVQQCALTVCTDSSFAVQETIDMLSLCLSLGAQMNQCVDSCQSIAYGLSKSYTKEGSMDDLREFLWKNGFDPNARDREGYPILWLAAANRQRWRNHIATIWTLHPDLDLNISSKSGTGHVIHWSTSTLPTCVLAHPKLDINKQNTAGDTILDYAITNEEMHEKIFEFIKYGVDATRTTSEKGSYLHLWINTHSKQDDREKIQSVVNVLLDNGVKIDSMNADGYSALHLAAQKGTLEMVKILLESGANINGHPDSETTPLHLAAERGDVELVTYLLDQGADRTKRNSAGQLPKDVAALSAKELFRTVTAMPPITFKCKFIPVAKSNPKLPFPRQYAQCFFIGEYFYVWGGAIYFLDWFDDYGYVSLTSMLYYTTTCYRTKLGETPLIWKPIQVNLDVIRDHYITRTCAPVDGKIWFNTQYGENYAIWDPASKAKNSQFQRNLDPDLEAKNRWSHTPKKTSLHPVVLERQMFDFGDRVMTPLPSSLGIYDKSKHQFELHSVDQCDLDTKDFNYSHSLTSSNNSFWVRNQRSIYTMDTEKRRWLKSMTIPEDMEFVSSIISFGNRFLLSLVMKLEDDEPKCKLLILDTESGSRSYQDIEFNFSEFSMTDVKHYEPLQGKTIDKWRKEEPAQYEAAKQKVELEISRNNYPFKNASLAINGTTLVIFGGNCKDLWFTSDILTLDLTPLKSYLTLEQLAGIEAAKNSAIYSEEQLEAVPTVIRSRYNLW